MITVVSVAVSLAIAWGVFDTRVTVVERELIAIKQAETKAVSDDASLMAELKKIAVHLQDNQHSIDDLYRYMKKPIPPRYDY
jgi:hypothetical protein